MDIEAIHHYLQKLQDGTHTHHPIHHADMADYLESIKHQDVEKFFTYLDSLPLKVKAETLIELPTTFQVDFIIEHDADALALIVEVLDSDDAADFCQAIAQTDANKAEALFELLKHETQTIVTSLMHYKPNEAGSIMQAEVFQASSTQRISDAIHALSLFKQKNIGPIQNLFITDEAGLFLGTLGMDDLILQTPDTLLDDLVKQLPAPYSINAHDSVDAALQLIEKYNITSLAVVDANGHLIGRITHDDAVDVMQKRATQQIYNLNKINQNEELHESFGKTSKTRSIWLTVNLVNAIIASMVIGFFEETLSAIVALAILMPIVANMAGTASVQTMTVMVRQMALGQIGFSTLRPVFIKELGIAGINGIWFGIISAVVAQVWFGHTDVSISIGLSMFVSFIFAGVLGTSVPVLLKKLGFDPAVASSVIVITLVDIIGFFSFLWFAQIIALP